MPELFTWVGNHPEPCDRCERLVYQHESWVASRDPWAIQGVRFLCRACHEFCLKRQLEDFDAIIAQDKAHDRAKTQRAGF